MDRFRDLRAENSELPATSAETPSRDWPKAGPLGAWQLAAKGNGRWLSS